MIGVGLELDLACGPNGPLRPALRRLIEECWEEPSAKSWERAECIIVGRAPAEVAGDWLSLRTAVYLTLPLSEVVEFRKSGRFPDRAQMERALRYATH